MTHHVTNERLLHWPSAHSTPADDGRVPARDVGPKFLRSGEWCYNHPHPRHIIVTQHTRLHAVIQLDLIHVLTIAKCLHSKLLTDGTEAGRVHHLDTDAIVSERVQTEDDTAGSLAQDNLKLRPGGVWVIVWCPVVYLSCQHKACIVYCSTACVVAITD